MPDANAPAPAAAPAAAAPTHAEGAKPNGADKGLQTPAKPADPKAKPGPGAAKPPAELTPAEKRRFKVKHRGADVEVDEDQAPELIQLGLGAKAKFTELDQEKKAFEAARAKAKEDVDEYLKSIGHDPEKWAYERLNRIVEQEAATPEQKEAKRLDSERKKLEGEKKAWEDQRAEEKHNEEQLHTLSILKEHLPKALEEAGLPQGGRALQAVVEELKVLEAAGEPITPEAIARATKVAAKERREDLVAFTKELKGKALVDFLGKEVADEVRRHDLEEWRKRQGGSATPEPKVEPAPTPEKRTWVSEAELNRELRKLGSR